MKTKMSVKYGIVLSVLLPVFAFADATPAPKPPAPAASSNTSSNKKSVKRGGQEIGGGGDQVLAPDGTWKVEEAFISASDNKLLLTEDMKEMTKLVRDLLEKYNVTEGPLSAPDKKYPIQRFFTEDINGPVRYVFVDSPADLKEKCGLEAVGTAAGSGTGTERIVGCTSEAGTSYLVKDNYGQYADLKNQFLGIMHVRLQHWCHMLQDSLGYDCRQEKSHRRIKDFVAAVNTLLDAYQKQHEAVIADRWPDKISEEQHRDLSLIARLGLAIGLYSKDPDIKIDQIGGGLIVGPVNAVAGNPDSFIGIGSRVSGNFSKSLVLNSDVRQISEKNPVDLKNTWVINSNIGGGAFVDSYVKGSKIDPYDDENEYKR
jgi:hypothetical protein